MSGLLRVDCPSVNVSTLPSPLPMLPPWTCCGSVLALRDLPTRLRVQSLEDATTAFFARLDVYKEEINVASVRHALATTPFAPALLSFFVLTAPINMHPRIPHCICRQFGGNIKKGTCKRLAETATHPPSSPNGGGRSWLPLRPQTTCDRRKAVGDNMQ